MSSTVLDPFVPDDEIEIIATCETMLETDGSLRIDNIFLEGFGAPYLAYRKYKRHLEVPDADNTFSAYHLGLLLHDSVLTVVSLDDAQAAEHRRIQVRDGQKIPDSEPRAIYAKTYRLVVLNPMVIPVKQIRDPFVEPELREVIATGTMVLDPYNSFTLRGLFGEPYFFNILDAKHGYKRCSDYRDMLHTQLIDDICEYDQTGQPYLIAIHHLDHGPALDRRNARREAQHQAERAARRKEMLAYPANCAMSWISAAKHFVTQRSSQSTHKCTAGMSSMREKASKASSISAISSGGLQKHKKIAVELQTASCSSYSTDNSEK